MIKENFAVTLTKTFVQSFASTAGFFGGLVAVALTVDKLIKRPVTEEK